MSVRLRKIKRWWRRRVSNYPDLKIDDIYFGDGVMVISWSDPSLGFGEYTIYNDLSCDSELMDRGNDKYFIKALMREFVRDLNV